MVRKLLLIDFIVKIILNYLKNLSQPITITTNIQGVL